MDNHVYNNTANAAPPGSLAGSLLAQRGLGEPDARFDVVSVRFDREPPEVEHVAGAFEVAGCDLRRAPVCELAQRAIPALS